MKKTMMLVAVAALSVGCKKNKPEEGTKPTTTTTTTTPTTGSAGSGSAAVVAETPKPTTPEDKVKRLDECWGFGNAGNYDGLKSCYTADAVIEQPGGMMPAVNGPDAAIEMFKAMKTAFPDMKGEPFWVMVSGPTIISANFISGTNSGPMKTPMGEMPATNKKVGFVNVQVVETDDMTKAKHIWEFVDSATMMGQLGQLPKEHQFRGAIDKAPMAREVVITKDDDKEKANIAADKAFIEAFNKHDAKAFGAALDDKLVWVESAEPKDMDKKGLLTAVAGFWKAFSDVKLTPQTQWAAGDYVATVGTIEGTNDGDMPMMKMKKTGKKITIPYVQIDKFANGKVAASWVMYQSMAMGQQLGIMPAPGAGAGSGSGAGSAAAPKK